MPVFINKVLRVRMLPPAFTGGDCWLAYKSKYSDFWIIMTTIDKSV